LFEELKREISSAPFVAMLLDETANTARLSIMVRYVTSNGTAEERFLGFSDVSGVRFAKAFAEHVLKCLNEYGFGVSKHASPI
jgi:hypothetical protein